MQLLHFVNILLQALEHNSAQRLVGLGPTAVAATAVGRKPYKKRNV